MSEELNEYQKLVLDLSVMQQTMIVPKNRFNKFGGYKYRSCEDIVEAAKEHMPSGCILLLTDEMIALGDRFYIKATAALARGEKSIEAFGYAREAREQKGMSEGQITGSASSYARKYALCGLFAIDDGVDDDSTGENKVVAKALPPATPLPELIERLKGAVDKFTTLDQFKEWQSKQPVKDARDRIFAENIKLSEELEDHIVEKTSKLS